MATMDDKLLGEKLQYYYSSSDEEEDHGGDDDCSGGCSAVPEPSPGVDEFSSGSAVRTGPKGVIADWRRFKQLETEKRKEQADERTELAKKLSLTCRTYDDDVKDKDKEVDEELDGLDLEDEFMRQYREQRMREMAEKIISNRPVFGSVVELTREDYVGAIDNENKTVLVVVHVYGNSITGCVSLDGCIQCLALEYPNVKFCRAAATAIQVSHSFCTNGLPALLVYRGGQLIGNFVKITDQLGDDFFAVELEAFLQDHGLLPNKQEQKTITGGAPQEESGDSDLDLD